MTQELLTANGYVEVSSPVESSTTPSPRLYEDAYGIVAIYAFDTWYQLREQWHVAQGQLVDLISVSLRRAEPKAWEGYLVLLTPGRVPLEDATALNAIRGDISRVRKLVATGNDLVALDDVRTALLPLLPLSVDVPASGQAGLLDLLPDLLGHDGIPRNVTNAVIDAFTANESVLERLHDLRTSG
jgi:hypothetical protein